MAILDAKIRRRQHEMSMKLQKPPRRHCLTSGYQIWGYYGAVELLLRVGKVLDKNQNKKHDLLSSYHLKGAHGKNQVLYRTRADETLAVNNDGNTALHESMLCDHTLLGEIAINKPMLIHVKDEDGLSPPDFASSVGFFEVVNFLQDWLKQETIGTDALGVNTDFLKNARIIRNEGIMQSVMLERRNEEVQRLIDEMPPEDSTQLGGDQPMSLDLYMYAKKGRIDSVLSFLSPEYCTSVSEIYNYKTPLQNTIVHVAASFGNEDFTRGDTALHVAAAAGHLGVVKILLSFQTDQMRIDSLLDVDIESNNETLIGKFIERVQVNDDGNTPLHEALMHNHGKVTEYLIKEKVEDAYYVNKQGKSTLYMALEANNVDYVQAILSPRISDAYRRILYKEVIKGKSLVHAAITLKSIVLLKEIIKMKTAIMHITDENGQTPLHHAASTNFAVGVQYFLLNHKMHIFKTDADGFFPIHCASKYGHVGILVEFLNNCLDAREFLNQDGQNILHVAAKYGKYGVVKYILQTPGLELLLNEKDKKGNTPLI
ncbi:hypothetical protein AgCh_016592 [Apium graveolens]